MLTPGPAPGCVPWAPSVVRLPGAPQRIIGEATREPGGLRKTTLARSDGETRQRDPNPALASSAIGTIHFACFLVGLPLNGDDSATPAVLIFRAAASPHLNYVYLAAWPGPRTSYCHVIVIYRPQTHFRRRCKARRIPGPFTQAQQCIRPSISTAAA